MNLWYGVSLYGVLTFLKNQNKNLLKLCSKLKNPSKKKVVLILKVHKVKKIYVMSQFPKKYWNNQEKHMHNTSYYKKTTSQFKEKENFFP